MLSHVAHKMMLLSELLAANLKGFSFVCSLMWYIELGFLMHNSHLNGFSFVCILMCFTI